MGGASFVRADLHVHTFPDNDREQAHSLSEYIAAAVAQDIRILAITDHNTVKNVREAISCASGQPLLLVPGIEITTHEGHLLALFDPARIEVLEEFAGPSNLRLQKDPVDPSLRSDRGILDLVGEIHRRGGLAIPAHVDLPNGISDRMSRTALIQLLSHDGLAGIEFADHQSIRHCFSESDENDDRKDAWATRQQNEVLRNRGLARVMSSDAHSPAKVGNDTARRTLTRIRIDDLNFSALKNALLFNPKARCKAEAHLPLTYPHVKKATFEGGFLHEVALEFSQNLNCIIGGRGSGKSTALIAIRAALGATLRHEDDPDQSERMPDKTVVEFIDSLGSHRVAVRERGGQPYEQSTQLPIEQHVADLSQGESGQLARGYETDPATLRTFLDQFVQLEKFNIHETDLLAELKDNEAEIARTQAGLQDIDGLKRQVQELEGSLNAARTGKIEEIADWANRLASEEPLLHSLSQAINKVRSAPQGTTRIDLDQLAGSLGVDLAKQPAKQFVEGPPDLRTLLAELSTAEQTANQKLAAELDTATEAARSVLQQWILKHQELIERLNKIERELAEKGLKVEAGAARQLAERLTTARTRLNALMERQRENIKFRREREGIIRKLHNNRELIFQRRKATLRQVVELANAASDGPTIHLSYVHQGDRTTWADWLSSKFRFRSPRVQRIAEAITPMDLATGLLTGREALEHLQEANGSQIFEPVLAQEAITQCLTWETLVELQTMRLEDRVSIHVQEPGSSDRRPFEHLSAGQQRSVLLGLILCAGMDEPLITDQPEDHLDAQYIATAIVRHLEAAKEKRQVLLATHNANLTVLGDAEMVIPMYAEHRHGSPRDCGAVDRPSTRARVCELLEGGAEAYKRRGQRYGFQVEL